MNNNNNKNKNNLKKPKSEKIKQATNGIVNSMQNTKSDPNGSYTGVPTNPYETPVQDADDL